MITPSSNPSNPIIMAYQPRPDIPPERQPHAHWVSDTGCLLMHGFMGSPQSTRPLAAHLAQQGISSYAPLWPGHGHLPDKIRGVSHQDWLAAAEEALALMRQKCRHIVLVGHSMGAVLAAHLAHHHADMRGLVLLAPLYTVPDPRIQVVRLLRYVMPYVYPLRLPGFPPDLAIGRATDFDPTLDLSDPAVQRWLPRGTRIPTSGLAEMCRMAEVGRALWPQLRLRTVVIQGGHDRALKPQGAHALFAALTMAHKEIVWLEEANHDLVRPSEAAHTQVWEKIIEVVRGGEN